MLAIHSSLLYLHIAAGVLAMFLFWVPVVSRKGGLNHRRFGRVYAWTMYTVGISAVLMSSMVLIAPTYFKAAVYEKTTNPAALTEMIYGFWTLLLVLSLLTLTSIHQAMLSLKTRSDRSLLKRPQNLLAPVALGISATVLLVATISGLGQTVLGYIFSLLGIISALQALHYAFAKSVHPNRWLIEHLSGMLGSGIAVYTAFFAFGARHLLDFLGQWQLLFWILPGVVGGVAISWWSRRYKTPKVVSH